MIHKFAGVIRKIGKVGWKNSVATGMIDDSAVTTAKILNSNVTTAKINDNAVTVDKMAHGGGGKVLGFDTVSGALVQIGPGAAGVALVSNGGAANCAFAGLQAAGLANNIVGQSKLSTALSGDVGGSGNFTLPGGAYGFYPQVRSLAGSPSTQIAGGRAGTSFNTNIYFTDSNGRSRQGYMSGSPPYDLGDGDIPLFVFVIVAANGDPIGYYVAADPPWAYNGPTNIVPTRIDEVTGKKYQRRRRIPHKIRAALDDPGKKAEMEAALDADDDEEIELTQDVKQADMPLLPHPFTGNDLTGKTVILLDPMSKTVEHLAKLQLDMDSIDPDESICDLIQDGYVKFGNVGLPRSGPPGVLVVSAKWK